MLIYGRPTQERISLSGRNFGLAREVQASPQSELDVGLGLLEWEVALLPKSIAPGNPERVQDQRIPIRQSTRIVHNSVGVLHLRIAHDTPSFVVS
jgi:hypothetical protein